MQTRSNDDYTQLEFNKDGVTFKNIHVDWKDDDFLKTHPNPPRIMKLMFYLNRAQNEWDKRRESKYQPKDMREVEQALLLNDPPTDDEQSRIMEQNLAMVCQQMEIHKIITLVNRGAREIEKRNRAGRFSRLVLLNPNLAHFLSVLRAVDFERALYLIEKYYFEVVPDFRPKSTPVVDADYASIKWIDVCVINQPKLQFSRETGKLTSINN